MALTKTALRLRQLRTDRNLSQQDVADYLGITRTAYNKYESGVIQPTRTVKKLAALYGVSTDFILSADTLELQSPAITISLDEHIKKYLALSEDSRNIIDLMVRELYQKEQRALSRQLDASADES